MSRKVVLCALALVLACAAGATAHDLWIEPSSFTPVPGVRLAVRLFIGQLFEGDPFPRDPKLMLRFAVISGSGGSGGAGGETPIAGVPDTDPAGFLVAGRPGLYELVYASGHAAVQLDAAKFERYLADEGLDTVSAARARAGRSGTPAKEIFSRCAKSLIVVGGDAGAGSQRALAPLGLVLELVPERNPYTLAAGQELPLRLLYGGRALPGAKVTALLKPRPDRQTGPASPDRQPRQPRQVSARTDAQGRVSLPLAEPGVWLVKAVHMIAAPPGSGADWESFWASLTFALPGTAAR
jgi:uncharacterized GH25 family protein